MKGEAMTDERSTDLARKMARDVEYARTGLMGLDLDAARKRIASLERELADARAELANEREQQEHTATLLAAAEKREREQWALVRRALAERIPESSSTAMQLAMVRAERDELMSQIQEGLQHMREVPGFAIQDPSFPDVVRWVVDLAKGHGDELDKMQGALVKAENERRELEARLRDTLKSLGDTGQRCVEMNTRELWVCDELLRHVERIAKLTEAMGKR